MPRRLLLPVTFLLLGAAINIVVAVFSFAFVTPTPGAESESVATAWPYPAPPGWPAPGPSQTMRNSTTTFVLVESLEQTAERDSGRERSSCEMSLCQIGRPFRSLGMYSTVDRRHNPAAPAAAGPNGGPGVASRVLTQSHGTLELSKDWQDRLGLPWLPVRPVWPGFAVNTLLFSALAYVPVGVLFWARRRARRLRGQCGACGYPVGVSAVCTECGSPLPMARGPVVLPNLEAAA